MIIASLLLILIAAVLLVFGLLRELDILLVVSIAVSLLAAVALYLGARRSRADRRQGDPAPAANGPVESTTASRSSVITHSGAGPVAARSGLDATATRSLAQTGDDDRPPWPLEQTPGQPAESAADDLAGLRPGGAGDAWRTERGGPTERADDADAGADDPLDEPPEQRTPRSDAELISRLPAEVLVVDGRPRYHVTGCPHLLDREAEPLPVAEAVELGFGPCGWCQPDTVLLGGTPDGP